MGIPPAGRLVSPGAQGRGHGLQRVRARRRRKGRPHLVTAANVSEAAQQVGLEEIKDALGTYATCAESGLWPGYASEIIDLDLPEWAYKRRFAA